MEQGAQKNPRQICQRRKLLEIQVEQGNKSRNATAYTLLQYLPTKEVDEAV